MELMAEVIFQRFAAIGIARSVRNYYEFIRPVPNGICIQRQNGNRCTIQRDQLCWAIDAVQRDPQIYYTGPISLWFYIDNKRRLSPLWAMLRLLTLDEILDMRF